MQERSFLYWVKTSFQIPAVYVALLWVIFILQYFTGLSFGLEGIFPRRIFGLEGILTAPLVHHTWSHLISNSIPLLVMGSVIIFFYRRVFVQAYLLIHLLTGLAVWLLGRPVYHIGASGVVYGLVAFVFWTGLFRKSLQSIVLALMMVLFYAPMFAGVLPGQEGISWESHLFGGLVGILVAYIFRDDLEVDEKTRPSWETEGSPEKTYFLSRDIFDKTKSQRKAEEESGWHTDSTI